MTIQGQIIQLIFDLKDFWWEIRGHYPKSEKPIFLVGCAKSGTTLLGLLFLMHPDTGPKMPYVGRYNSRQDFLDAVLQDSDSAFVKAALEMEQVQLWHKFFPFKHVDLNIGKELILYESPLNQRELNKFIRLLTRKFHESRFFSKQPWNTFRIHVLRQLFPDAKIVAIHRDGRDVVSSWGRRVDRWNNFNGYSNAISVFSRKWNEAVEHIENYKHDLNIYTLRYEDLLKNHIQELKKIFNFCELDYLANIYDHLKLKQNAGKWKKLIPTEFHPQLQEKTCQNLKRLGYFE